MFLLPLPLLFSLLPRFPPFSTLSFSHLSLYSRSKGIHTGLQDPNPRSQHTLQWILAAGWAHSFTHYLQPCSLKILSQAFQPPGLMARNKDLMSNHKSVGRPQVTTAHQVLDLVLFVSTQKTNHNSAQSFHQKYTFFRMCLLSPLGMSTGLVQHRNNI